MVRPAGLEALGDFGKNQGLAKNFIDYNDFYYCAQEQSLMLW
jgi:hypothetical protein